MDILVVIGLLPIDNLVLKALKPFVFKLRLTQHFHTREHLAIWSILEMLVPPHPSLILNEVIKDCLFPSRVEFLFTFHQQSWANVDIRLSRPGSAVTLPHGSIFDSTITLEVIAAARLSIGVQLTNIAALQIIFIES